MDDWAGFVGCLVLLAIASIGGCCVGDQIGASATNQRWQKLCVERGLAKWEIIDATGKTEWKWNDGTRLEATLEATAEATGE